MEEEQENGEARLASPIQREAKSPYQLKEERKKRAYLRDQFQRQLSSVEKKLQGVEESLNEATETLDQLNQKLSDSSLYLNQRETFETIEAHRKTQERVKELTERWESLAFQLEEMKAMGMLSTSDYTES